MLARKFAALAYHAEFAEAVDEEVTEDTQFLEPRDTTGIARHITTIRARVREVRFLELGDRSPKRDSPPLLLRQ